MKMPVRYAAVDTFDLLSGRADTIRIGYAAREKIACRLGEQDCGQTVSPYHACCPGNTECVSPGLNARCCKPDVDCTSALTKLPQCANPEHDMYDFDGFFCCEQGKKGYGNTKTDGDGCGDQDYKLGDFEEWLTIQVSGRAITTSASKTVGAPSATSAGSSKTTTTNSSSHTSTTASDSTTTTGSSGTTSTPTTGSSSATAPSADAPTSTEAAAGKSSNGGAIAGGVIGGIAAIALIAFLIWFLRRRKAKSYASTAPSNPSGSYHAVEEQGAEKGVPLAELAKKPGHQAGESVGDASIGGVSELPGKEKGDAAAAELYGQEGNRAAELYSPSVATTAELHGVERGPGELPAWDGRGVPAQLRPGDKGGPVELP